MAFFILLGPGACRRRRISEVRDIGVSFTLLPAIQHGRRKARGDARNGQQGVSFVQQKLLPRFTFALVQTGRYRLRKTLRCFQTRHHALHLGMSNAGQPGDFTAADGGKLIMGLEIFNRNYHRFHPSLIHYSGNLL